jgi:hypothetical protein
MCDQHTQPTLAGAEFNRRVLVGLKTPRAFIRAVLEDYQDHERFGISNWAPEYAEPGYGPVKDGACILFGNWNEKTEWKDGQRTVVSNLPERFSKIAEYAGYEMEWEDEWSTCEDCGKAVRTNADSYGWTRSYVILGECSLVCRDCVDEEDYISDYLLNESGHADTFGIDLSSYGFTKLNSDSFENGWHPGQNDSPAEIVKHLPNGVEFVFQIDNVGQFDVRFSCWTRPTEDGAGECEFTAEDGRRYHYVDGYLVCKDEEA